MANSLPIFQVDAFTSRLFQGNPAAVVPLQEWLPDPTMQLIARENNLSETAFFVPIAEGYHLRWFTPTVEVDFCGHATLASSHVLFEHLGFPGVRIHFDTRVGRLSVAKQPDGYEMDAPADTLRPVSVPEGLPEALGVEVNDLLQGREDLLAVVSSEEDVRALQPDFSAIRRLTNRGLLVSAPGEEVDFVSRCFFPNAGIDEDPVTGSAHTTLTPYWAGRLGKNGLVARQLSGRGGEIHCRLEGDRVALAGQAVTFLKGDLFLPGSFLS